MTSIDGNRRSRSAYAENRSCCVLFRCSVSQLWLTSPRSTAAFPRRSRQPYLTDNPTPVMPTSTATMIQVFTDLGYLISPAAESFRGDGFLDSE